MNFLAHQLLSFDVPPVMVGNFIADTLRGSARIELPEPVMLGVQVHRYIDHFTDTHADVLECRKLLYPWFSKYASVVQDVFFDHFLALDWGQYHEESLPAFAKRVYSTLHGYDHLLNERARRTLHYMSLQGWLENYVYQEGIHRALSGLAHRAAFASNMERSLPALQAHFREMKALFDQFFSQLHQGVCQNYGVQIDAISRKGD